MPNNEERMSKVNVGDTVYWLSVGKDQICSGEVLYVSDRLAPGGEPVAIMVEYGDDVHLRRACYTHDRYFLSPTDCYRHGVAELSRTVTSANAAMMSLVDSMQKAGDGSSE
jgi:hypothetical protein